MTVIGSGAEVATLSAACHLRAGRLDDAVGAMIEARTHAISSGDAVLEAELAYYGALYAFGRGDAADARSIVERALETLDGALGGGHAVLLPSHAAARLHEMLLVLAASGGRYRDAIAHARAVVTSLDAAIAQDVYLDGYGLKNLAVLARDFDLADSDEICRRVDTLAWTRDIATVQFNACEAAGWCAALGGDVVTALGRFRTAADVATAIPERIIVGLDRAILARESGFAPMAIEEVRHASHLRRAFAWEDAAGDDRRALLLLAQVAAPIDVAEARSAIDRYASVRASIDVRYAGRTEARLKAEESYTHGVVLRAEGRLDASRERLCTAFETWQTIGYEWRAARAALELAELDAGDVFRLAVRRDLNARPRSVFSARARLVA